MSVHQPSTSHITQCVAAKAIIKHGGKVLVLRQSSEAAVDNANRYHPPGGIVEPGESLRQTLAREVTEETGLQVDIGKILTVEEWRVTIRGEACQFFGAFFECHLLSDDDIKLDEESSGFAWVDLDGLAGLDVVEPSLERY